MRREALLCIVPLVALIFSSGIVLVHASEPTLTDVLDHVGFPSVVEIADETFPPGTYNITLYAEFAALYESMNELSCYETETSSFETIFTGPEGVFGYISPEITKTISMEGQFGFSLFCSAHGYRYFSETSRNHDGQIHAEVYRSLDDPNTILVGFDDRSFCNGSGDYDYNDMVFSIRLQYFLDVVSQYDTPVGEGWYYHGSTAFASLVDSTITCDNGTRRTFTHWSGDSSGTNYSRSNPILIDRNKTAIADWKTEHYLTVQTSPIGLSTPPTPPSNWYSQGTNLTLLAVTENYLGTTKYLFDYWTKDGEPQTPGANSIIVNMNQSHVATAYYRLATCTLTILHSHGGTTDPTPGNYTYAIGANALVKAITHSGYRFDHWMLDNSPAGSLNPVTVLMNQNHTLKTIFSSTLSVAIQPLLTQIFLGNMVIFESMPTGGVAPYTYTWYLNGTEVSGATSDIWTFTPASAGLYLVQLRVIDADLNIALSEIAKVKVVTPYVGGCSVTIEDSDFRIVFACYSTLMLAFAAILRLFRSSRRTRQ